MNCLITGASYGIGKNLAIKFAKLGYNLFLTYYTNEELCKKIQTEIQTKYNVKCIIKKLDLSNENSIKESIKVFKEHYNSLDILINNASTYCDNLIMDKTKNEFMKVLEVNVVGTFLITKYLHHLMNKNSIIINMSSTDGINTYNEYNIDYSVSKAAIIQLTKSLSYIYKEQKVIAVAPNWVKTESTNKVNKDFLEKELKRINQKELISVDKVTDKIIQIINNKEKINENVVIINE